jgi:hypothetical protein
VIFGGMEDSKKWQIKEGALRLLVTLAKTAPAQVSACLPAIVPLISERMVDAREQVRPADMGRQQQQQQEQGPGQAVTCSRGQVTAAAGGSLCDASGQQQARCSSRSCARLSSCVLGMPKGSFCSAGCLADPCAASLDCCLPTCPASHVQVKVAATEAGVATFKLVGNRDIEHILDDLLHCVARPNEVPDVVTKLSATTFVQVRAHKAGGNSDQQRQQQQNRCCWWWWPSWARQRPVACSSL